MRDLTEEELKLAPDWATHYIVDRFNDAVYQSENLCWWLGLRSPLNHSNMDEGVTEIIRKPFDITKHEFSEGLSISNMCKLSVEVKFNNNDDSNYVPLHKDDVIAIAKALGVTGEDLK